MAGRKSAPGVRSDREIAPTANPAERRFRALIATWPQEVHDALARRGLTVDVDPNRPGGRCAVVLCKRGGKHCEAALPLLVERSDDDLGRLCLLDQLEEQLAEWDDILAHDLEIRMGRVREMGLEP